jgi:3-phenylpropionate/trans-cinnamate dioxygenase ferredoxin component
MSARKAAPAVQPAYVKVATLAQIPPGHSHLVEVDDVRVALFNLKGEIYAIEDICTHDGGPLVEGTIVDECEVKCPRHGARFDIRTGAALSFPAIRPTQSYAVRIEGENVLIGSPE